MNFRTVKADENRRLTSWLKSKRKERGHTMRSLAEKLGMQHSFIGKVEKQERRLDVVEFIRYCNALEIDPMEGVRQLQSDGFL
nr:helix-turn-helix transcriptional regulator [Algicola sagamiensis]